MIAPRLDAPWIEFYSYWITASREYHKRYPNHFPQARLHECLEEIRDKATDA